MSDNIDPKLLEAISFFEKMFETMPEDRTGLEFLAVAYEQTGETDKQISTLATLSEVLLKEKDFEHAAMIVDKLKGFEGSAEAQMAIKIAEMILTKSSISATRSSASDDNSLFIKKETEPKPKKAVSDDQVGKIQSWITEAVKAEIELVWYWKDHNVLPKDVCINLSRVFMNHPVTDVPVLVSALGLLEEQHPEYTMTAFEDLQNRSRLPAIPLELFNVSEDVFSVLPAPYIQVKGVIPFAEMGGEYMIGVLNPLNEALQDEVGKLASAACHFYCVHPAVWRTVTQTFVE